MAPLIVGQMDNEMCDIGHHDGHMSAIHPSSVPAPVAARWRRRPPELAVAEASRTGLRRHLGRLDLTAIGVGSMVGAGIFVTTGVAAATKAGPAIMLSFVLAGAICMLAALCYSELAAMVPVSGSAYTYTYATLGEVVAFIVGWDLLLEFVVAGSAVAIGWSGMLDATLQDLFGFHLPHAIAAPPSAGGVVNLPAILLLVGLVAVLVRGVRLTAKAAKWLVGVTIGVLVLVVVVGATDVDPSNWTPFTPFGGSGIVSGAALAFFAFLGFDIVATSAEETERPQRDVPFGIIASVAIATVLYVAVSGVLTGLAPYTTLNNPAPVATALSAAGSPWITHVILVGSVVALTKGALMIFYGQTRLLFAMSRDRLLPEGLSHTDPRTGTPNRATVVLAILAIAIAGFLSIDTVAELVNVGALFAFSLVAIGVLVLRVLEPDRERPFRTPLVPLVPLLAIGGCVWLATTLAGLTWVRFLVWMAIGLAIYLLYGRSRSTLVARRPVPGPDAPR